MVSAHEKYASAGLGRGLIRLVCGRDGPVGGLSDGNIVKVGARRGVWMSRRSKCKGANKVVTL